MKRRAGELARIRELIARLARRFSGTVKIMIIQSLGKFA
jgi:hypothetical protein